MKILVRCLQVALLVVPLSAAPQTTSIGISVNSTSAEVPKLVKFSGTATDEVDKPISGVVGVTFSLYKDQQGGAPLWVETQNVQADANGHYTAMLGASTSNGVPLGIFGSAEAHWVGTQVSGHREQPRVLLLSVPYALKAADAETLGGLPASAFMHAPPKVAGKGGSETTSSATNPLPPAGVTGKGTKNFVPLWTGATTQGNSTIYETGSNIGIGTKTPKAAVDVASNDALGIQATVPGTQAAIAGIATATKGGATGTYGQSSDPGGNGVFGMDNATTGGIGTIGISQATSGTSYGVYGQSASPSGYGVFGNNTSTSGFANGVFGSTASTSDGATGVNGHASAKSGGTFGVYGQSDSISGSGVFGNVTATSGQNFGVFGISASPNGKGVAGVNSAAGGIAVFGNETATSGFTYGVYGSSSSPSGSGVFGINTSTNGNGVFGQTEGTGAGPAAGGFAAHGGGGMILQGMSGSAYTVMFYVDAGGNGFYSGNLNVKGMLTKGSGSFKIDHPVDPGNKYLSHSFVESPDMMNIYNGVVVLDAHGSAWVMLPNYFEALNRDFRYQLTAIGAPGPNLYIAQEVSGNRFRIAGGKPHAKVSWQVTGIRHDAYANAYRIPTEEDKPSAQQGYYLHPEVFGQPESKSIQATTQNASPTDQMAKVSNP